MPLYSFNPTIKRANPLGISIYLPKKGGNTITPPAILTTGEVTEKADDTLVEQSDGTTFSLAISDEVDLSIVYYGLDAQGGIAVSAPSPALTYTATGAAVGLEIKPTSIPAGIVAIGLLAKFAGQTVSRLVDLKPYQAGAVLSYRKPTADAPAFNEFNDNSSTLVEAGSITFPAIVSSPTKTVNKMLNDREIHNGQNVTTITSSSIVLEGEMVSPDVKLEQLINGGGQYITDSDGVVHLGEGYVKGFCQRNLWFNLFESANECGSQLIKLILGTFAVDSTAVSKDTNNLPFTITQQDNPFIKGVFPTPACVV